MSDNGCEQVFVELLPAGSISLSSYGEHGLESLERLQGSLEADGARVDQVLACRLGHDGANEVVRQNMRPNFLPHNLRRFASKTLHLHDRFDAPQVQLVVPASPVQQGKFFFRVLDGVQERRDDDDGFRAEAWLLDADASLANDNRVRESMVGGPVDRSYRGGLWPADKVVVFAEAFPASKVGSSMCFVETRDDVDSAVFA